MCTCVFELVLGPIPAKVHPLPEGYLFVCPAKDLQIGPASFRWPTIPAYWSSDPSGVNLLSAEAASDRGFPAIELRTAVYGRSWDASVYAGLQQFHAAKGFDPLGQDVARYLCRPLYQPFGLLDNHGEKYCLVY